MNTQHRSNASGLPGLLFALLALCFSWASAAQEDITEKEWQAMVGEFRKTQKKFTVPEAEQKELIELLGTTRKDIVKA